MGSMQLNLFDSAEFVRWCEELFAAYFECRRNKRYTPGVLAFERHFERELFLLAVELYMRNGTARCRDVRAGASGGAYPRALRRGDRLPHPGAEERLGRAAA